MAVDLVMDAPSFVVPGRPFDVAIEVVVTHTPVVVDRITIAADGHVSGGTPAAWNLPPLIAITHQVHHDGRLAVGRHRFIDQLQVVADAPPTFRSKHHGVRLQVTARVHRSGIALDRTVKRELEIRCPVTGPIVPEPVEATNRAFDDLLAIKLSSRRVGRGETISFELTGSRFDHDRPVEVDVRLVETHEIADSILGDSDDWYWCRKRVTIPAPGPSGERAPVKVSITPPRHLLPSFDTYGLRHRWELVCHARGRMIDRPDLVVPLDIVDVDPEAAATVTSQLSDHERIESQFDALVAEGNWRRIDGEPDAPGSPAAAYELQLGMRRVQLQLGFTYATAGPTIVSRLRHPSLGVGLDVIPSTPGGERFLHEMTAGVAAWDRLYCVTASDEPAAKEILCAVVPELVSAEHLGSIVRWTDDALELETATNDPPLVRMAAQLERIAAALIAQLPEGPHDGVYR